MNKKIEEILNKFYNLILDPEIRQYDVLPRCS